MVTYSMPPLHHLFEIHARELYQRLQESAEKSIYNLSIPHLGLLLCLSEVPFIVVEDSPESALRLYRDIRFFNALLPTEPARSIVHFPPAMSRESIGERAKALLEVNSRKGSIVTSTEALETGLSLRGIQSSIVTIKRGLQIERDRLSGLLTALGYRRVSVVVEKGEYCQREWLFDVYPTTEDHPARVEFFGDEIEIIRNIDIETQRSLREIDELTILPAEEGEPAKNLLDEVAHFLSIRIFWAAQSPPTSPKENETGDFGVVRVSHLPFVLEGIDSDELSLKGFGILPEERKALEDVPKTLSHTNRPTLVVVPSTAQAVRLKEILFDGGMIAPIIEASLVPSFEGVIGITIGNLSSGLHIPGFLLLTDREIFGERPTRRPIKRSQVSRLLLTIDDLNPGDFVVHKDHGIGKFIGLQRQKTVDREEDVITLEYSHGDRLYIPFQSIERLQKYSAGEGRIPALDRLGGKSWQRTKQKVKEGIREMAEKLLRLYAERKVSRGFVFSEDTPLHHEFDEFFPYEETPDQIRAIGEIKNRMHAEKPMDMLLCGDVGYGKTEVAMRAAFRAVFDGRQVAVLVPTTLLAEQHFRTFKTRFSGFPVTIDYLSRFKSREDTTKCIAALRKGEIDIVIGTHMLLNKKVQFHDLGLLVIDEEHRFGVAQKERLKEIRKGVDVLTLTATPIPRTLHMSLSGIRDMCTIETPPEERLAVKSFVLVQNEKAVQEAIERELRRGGQTFYVHNRIKDIDKVAAHVKGITPDARIAAAHGQMREIDLEKIMLSFLNRSIDVLVCTAIIGSGLDIPTANTLVIDRADQFGLSDLYQLRGRVGRGTTQAYAYFLIPGEDLVTDEAKKRLQAIREMSYLGAGFRLALKDLEIRGAGNLLGSEQSGHIHRVGFELYMEMLEKAVAELKGEEMVDEMDPQIRLRLAAFVPEEYVPDITLRLSLYKRLSLARSVEALSDIGAETTDRFGSTPDEVNNLIHVVKMKILAKALYIERVLDVEGKYRFFFVHDPENRYRIPEGFFDVLLKVLFTLSSETTGRPTGLQFFPDGFELDLRGMPPAEAIRHAEEMLFTIGEKVRETPATGKGSIPHDS